jgi:hypothetical protein
MNAIGNSASLALLLALASGQAVAGGARTLSLGVAPPFPRAAGAEPARLPLAARPLPSSLRTAPRNPPAMASHEIRERALQSVLSGQEPAFEEAPRDGRLQLKFQRRGNAFKDLSRSYREMCDRASAKIWDEPNGKRVRFDVAGKPGVGVEIPLGRARR